MKNLTDVDVEKLLPGKIGPAKKLVLIIDGLKARHLSKTDSSKCSEDDVLNTPEKSTSTTSSLSDCSSHSRESSATPSESPRTTCFTMDALIPKYSVHIQSLLDNGNIMNDWDNFIQETAYYLLSKGEFKSKDQYSMIGKLMVQQYPCIGFFSHNKSQPWAHFTTTLSQKIRHIRWKLNRNKQRSESTEDVPSGKRRKKAPRQFFNIDTGEDVSSLTEEDALEIYKTELQKPQKEQNQPKILKAQRDTLQSRRRYIQLAVDGDLKTIVEKYPILKISQLLQKEFFLINDITSDKISGNWSEMLQKLQQMLIIRGDIDKDFNLETDDDLLIILEKVSMALKFQRKKKKAEMSWISETEVMDVDLSSKAKSVPRLLILRNDGNINNSYIVGDGIAIEVGKDIKNAIEVLLMTYYVFDLAYPKCHQILGFFQTYVLKDNAPFHKGANFIKFEKEYIET